MNKFTYFVMLFKILSKTIIFTNKIKHFDIDLEKAIIIILTLAIPLLVKGKLIFLPQEMIPHWIGKTHATDYFSFYRANLVLLSAVIIIINRLFKTLYNSNTIKYNNITSFNNSTNEYKTNNTKECEANHVSGNNTCSPQIFSTKPEIPYWIKIPIFIYFVSTIASIIYCDYPRLTIIGTPYRFEGSLVILSYLILLYSTIEKTYNCKDKKFIKLILYSIVFSATIIGFIGLTQLIGKDIVRSKEFINFITSDRILKEHISKINFDISKGIVYGLFGNTNYTGSYTSMIIPIAFSLYIYKERWQKWFSFLFYVLSFIVWIGCRSKAGWLGGAVAIIYICIILKEQIFKKAFKIFILLISSIVLIFTIDYISLVFKCDRLIDNFSFQKITHEQFLKSDLQDIILASDSFELIHESNYIKCKYEPPETYRFYNRHGEEVPYKLVKQTIFFSTKDFWGCLVKIATESKVVQITRENIQYNFMHTNEGFRMLDGLLRPFVPERAAKIGFYNNERWGNGRGYIWSRSIPLLLEAWLVGFGADMFYIYFPQNDVISKIRAGYPVNWYIDKPHNLYLQIGISSGIPALIAFIFLSFTYLYKVTILFIKNKLAFHQRHYLLIFTSPIIGYIVSGFFNDSVVGVAPIYWIILGIGIGYYLRLASKIKDDKLYS